MYIFHNRNYPEQERNVEMFRDVVEKYYALEFFQPSPERAPWHWKVIIDKGNDVVFLNFWPHLAKSQREGRKAVVGRPEMIQIIEEGLIDADEEPFEPFEAFE